MSAIEFFIDRRAREGRAQDFRWFGHIYRPRSDNHYWCLPQRTQKCEQFLGKKRFHSHFTMFKKKQTLKSDRCHFVARECVAKMVSMPVRLTAQRSKFKMNFICTNSKETFSQKILVPVKYKNNCNLSDCFPANLSYKSRDKKPAHGCWDS